jgi:hypothetical protein
MNCALIMHLMANSALGSQISPFITTFRYSRQFKSKLEFINSDRSLQEIDIRVFDFSLPSYSQSTICIKSRQEKEIEVHWKFTMRFHLECLLFAHITSSSALQLTSLGSSFAAGPVRNDMKLSFLSKLIHR